MNVRIVLSLFLFILPVYTLESTLNLTNPLLVNANIVPQLSIKSAWPRILEEKLTLVANHKEARILEENYTTESISLEESSTNVAKNTQSRSLEIDSTSVKNAKRLKSHEGKYTSQLVNMDSGSVETSMPKEHNGEKRVKRTALNVKKLSKKVHGFITPKLRKFGDHLETYRRHLWGKGGLPTHQNSIPGPGRPGRPRQPPNPFPRRPPPPSPGIRRDVPEINPNNFPRKKPNPFPPRRRIPRRG